MRLDGKSVHVFVRRFDTLFVRLSNKMSLHSQTRLDLGITDVAQDIVEGAQRATSPGFADFTERTCLAFKPRFIGCLLDKTTGCDIISLIVTKACSSSDSARMDPRDRRIAELEAQLREQYRLIDALREQIGQLQEELASAKRAGKRQATPFARKKRIVQAKRPGRRKGQGQFSYRRKPAPEEVTGTKEAPLACCPECGGDLIERKEHEQFVVDIPPVEPVITRYVTQSGYCPDCQGRVRSRHPEQISDATGAAGVVVGPRAKALAADMKHRLGASYGKVGALLNDAFGLRVTRSGWYQADTRLAQQARPVYEELVEALRESAVVHADETGWRIGTLSAWLWVFTNQETTVYTIRRSRGHGVVVDILGSEYGGILNSDCFLAYDAKADRVPPIW